MARITTGVVALALLGAAASAHAEQGVTKDTIVIGTSAAFTGPAAAFIKGWFTVEQYFNEINDKGGINGRKIKVVREDDACDPAKGIAAMKKLVSFDKVFLLDAGMCSNVALATRPIVEESGLPYVNFAAASDPIATPVATNIFQPNVPTSYAARALVRFGLGGKSDVKVAVVGHSDEWGQSWRQPELAELAKHKIQPVEDIYLERGATDATAQVLRLRQSGAQVIIANLYPTELVIFLRDAQKYGLKTPVVSTHAVSLEQTIERLNDPSAAANLYVFYPLKAPVGDPSMQKWVSLAKRASPKEQADFMSIIGLGGAVLIEKALRDAGPDLTRAKVIAALNNTRNFDTGVMAAPLTFTPEDHVGLKEGNIVALRGGKPTVVDSIR